MWQMLLLLLLHATDILDLTNDMRLFGTGFHSWQFVVHDSGDTT
jgi:hypothetical protein